LEASVSLEDCRASNLGHAEIEGSEPSPGIFHNDITNGMSADVVNIPGRWRTRRPHASASEREAGSDTESNRRAGQFRAVRVSHGW